MFSLGLDDCNGRSLVLYGVAVFTSLPVSFAFCAPLLARLLVFITGGIADDFFTKGDEAVVASSETSLSSRTLDTRVCFRGSDLFKLRFNSCQEECDALGDDCTGALGVTVVVVCTVVDSKADAEAAVAPFFDL